MKYRRAYVENSMIFLTLVTNERLPLLVDNISLIKQSAINTIKIYKYKIIAYTIQKDHIHCIIKPKKISDYPKIVKSFKYSFTKQFKENVGFVNPTYKNNSRSALLCRQNKIWQNRYWEHTIRNENDLHKHLDYIHYNSVKHNNIQPKDWEYSSFKKYVNNEFYDTNWYNIDDKNKILELNYE